MTESLNVGRWLGVCGLCISGFLLTGCYSNSLQASSTEAGAMGNPLVMLGLREDTDYEEIEYGPRAPLVIPAETNLPPPRTQMAAADPAWPDDPDARMRREREMMRRAAAEQTLEDVERASNPLSRAELDEWGRRFGEPRSTQQTASSRDPSGAMSPEELRARRADPDAVAAEPQRRRLSDPPTGYRQPADTGDVADVQQTERPGFFRRLFGGG